MYFVCEIGNRRKASFCKLIHVVIFLQKRIHNGNIYRLRKTWAFLVIARHCFIIY